VGQKSGPEESLIRKLDFPFINISAGKFRQYHKSLIINLLNPWTLFANIRDLFKMIFGFGQSIKILSKHKPDAIFVKGGYVGLPLGLAAYFVRIPFTVHESDIVPGLANRILGRFASKIFVSFPKENFSDYFDTKKIIETGNPIRKDILEGSKQKALKEFKLKPDLPTLLVMGGSQGSRQINEAVFESLETLLGHFQVIHIAGALDYGRLNFKTKKLEKMENYHLFDFLSYNLADAYAAADLIISRGGANSLFEIAALAKPVIIIPLASSASDHQYKNAIFFSRSNAAYLLPPEKLTSHSLIGAVLSLIKDPEEAKNLASNIKKLSNPESAQKIASEIIKLTETK